MSFQNYCLSHCRLHCQKPTLGKMMKFIIRDALHLPGLLSLVVLPEPQKQSLGKDSAPIYNSLLFLDMYPVHLWRYLCSGTSFTCWRNNTKRYFPKRFNTYLFPIYSIQFKRKLRKLKLKYQLTLQIIWIKVVHLYTIHQLHHKGSYIILLQQYKTIVWYPWSQGNMGQNTSM